MALNIYGTGTAGNPTNTYEIPELLMAVDVRACLDKFLDKYSVPMNRNEVVSLSRAVTPDVDTSESAEGVSKASRAITFENVSGTLGEYAESFAWSSRQANMGERDIFAACKDRLTDLVARTRELVAWYVIRNCTNVLYNSSAITSRITVNGVAGKGRYDLAVRFLDANGAHYYRDATKGSVNVNTTPLQPTFVCVGHTDRKSDIEALPGFIPAAQSPAKDALMYWHGTVGQIMFILTKELEPRLGAGAAVAGTGMKGTTNVDVYTDVIFGKGAFGRMSLGAKELGKAGLKFTLLKDADKSDVNNRLRILGTDWVDLVLILNQSWCIAIEQGVTLNPA
jgi:N4-gp56 family major capsid protein